jgi:SAM-dependent methyltransferase
MHKNLLLVFIASFIFFRDPLLGLSPTDSIYDSRFIKKNDFKISSLVGINFPSSWWSRPYEYAWAAQFTGSDLVVLDAACGISHPFKWMLTRTCNNVWACDSDSRIIDKYKIILETKRDLGIKAANQLLENPDYLENISLVNCSISDLPDFMPKFDRIFCISTLEHMTREDRNKTLLEFSRMLTASGLLIVTIDYPVVSPQEILDSAQLACLTPCSTFDTNIPADSLGIPADNIITNIPLNIFRCVFKKCN